MVMCLCWYKIKYANSHCIDIISKAFKFFFFRKCLTFKTSREILSFQNGLLVANGGLPHHLIWTKLDSQKLNLRTFLTLKTSKEISVTLHHYFKHQWANMIS